MARSRTICSGSAGAFVEGERLSDSAAGGAPTVTKNVSLAVVGPSVTVTVMVDVPFWPAVGVRVMVRSVPDPPKTILLTGTSAGLDEDTLSCRFTAGISASAIVKSIGPNSSPRDSDLIRDVRDGRRGVRPAVWKQLHFSRGGQPRWIGDGQENPIIVDINTVTASCGNDAGGDMVGIRRTGMIVIVMM